ncbi:MAG: hemerythrin family protein [Rhodocyclales bacterium]|nr:hemerythrin family protein [Rhodocyclales bacterium]
MPSIDLQHRRIFELAATFADSGDQIRMMKSLAILCDHVKTHFREEEEMMAACGFPGLAAHRQQHGECRKMLVDLLARARHMSLDQIADEVKQLINGWIYNHILTADFEYVPYLKAWQSGQAPVLSASPADAR